MRQNFVLRVTGELCVYFSLLFIIRFFDHWRLPMTAFVLSCFALGFLIVLCRSAVLRFLLSLLPGLCFLLCEPSLMAALPALAWLYYVLVMTRGIFETPLDDYRREYRILLLVCLYILGANLVNGGVFKGQMISTLSMIYVLPFLFLGVVAMRRMQMDAGMNTRWHLLNAAAVTGLPLLTVALSFLLFWLLNGLVPAVRVLLWPLRQFIIWLFCLLFPGKLRVEQVDENGTQPSPTAPPMEGSAETGESIIGAAEQETGNSQLIEQVMTVIAYVVIGLLLLLAIYLVVRYVQTIRRREDGEEIYYDEADAEGGGRRKRRSKKRKVGGNAQQLRLIYQTYLEFVSSHGVTVTRSDTSQEILELDQKRGESPEAERLRQLYIAARYGDPDAVTEEQVSEAEKCLETIQENDLKDRLNRFAD